MGTCKTSRADRQSGFSRLAIRFTDFAERWFPDSYIFVLSALLIVSVAALAIGVPVQEIGTAFGDGFFSLITFTMQLSLLIIAGFVVATSAPVARLINGVSRLPRSGHQAILIIAATAMFVSLFNWAMSLIFGGLLVRACARRDDIQMDYRAATAAAYLGVGTVWAFGIGSLAAQLQANADSLPMSLQKIAGVIPLSETVFLWPSLFILVIVFCLALVVAYFSVPSGGGCVTAEDLAIDVSETVDTKPAKSRPGEFLEWSPLLTVFVVGLGGLWLVQRYLAAGSFALVSNLNSYNFMFLMVGMLLHWRPRRFLNAVAGAIPSVTGVIIQFPFFGSIAAILTLAKNSSGQSLSDQIAFFLTQLISADSYPIVVALYSTLLGVFIPSGGGRWMVGAAPVLEAANALQIHLGWAVQIFNAVSMPLLINPFFMLPLVAIVGLRPRDIVGFTFLQFLWHLPIMLFLLWLFTGFLKYSPPVIPGG